jgi:hypothetical protein
VLESRISMGPAQDSLAVAADTLLAVDSSASVQHAAQARCNVQHGANNTADGRTGMRRRMPLQPASPTASVKTERSGESPLATADHPMSARIDLTLSDTSSCGSDSSPVALPPLSSHALGKGSPSPPACHGERFHASLSPTMPGSLPHVLISCEVAEAGCNQQDDAPDSPIQTMVRTLHPVYRKQLHEDKQGGHTRTFRCFVVSGLLSPCPERGVATASC